MMYFSFVVLKYLSCKFIHDHDSKDSVNVQVQLGSIRALGKWTHIYKYKRVASHIETTY